jgi:hypothetical protein
VRGLHILLAMCFLSEKIPNASKKNGDTGVRESASEEKVKEAHRKIMIANHPDAGGSSFIAAKVNEAKDILLGKKRGSGSIF